MGLGSASLALPALGSRPSPGDETLKTTWNHALRGDAWRLPQHGAWHVSGKHARRGHRGPPLYGSRSHGAWLLLCDVGPHAHDALRLLDDDLRFLCS